MAAVGYPKLALKTKFSTFSITIAIAMILSANSSPKAGLPEAAAHHIDHDLTLNAAETADDWSLANAITFASDWQGATSDPDRETQVRILWNDRFLYLRFECRYREIFVFADAEKSGRRDHLWDRDVAEVFLQPDPTRPTFYKEFEVSPNGMWIDLDISPAGLADLNSGMTRSVVLDERRKMWIAELAIPLKALTPQFDPAKAWRANFYRVEGATEPRLYMAWSPTNTPRPNFHVPACFGVLKFQK